MVSLDHDQVRRLVTTLIVIFAPFVAIYVGVKVIRFAKSVLWTIVYTMTEIAVCTTLIPLGIILLLNYYDLYTVSFGFSALDIVSDVVQPAVLLVKQ